jgi:hypothetical protein
MTNENSVACLKRHVKGRLVLRTNSSEGASENSEIRRHRIRRERPFDGTYFKGREHGRETNRNIGGD